jgi:hypothetical protein
MRPLTRIWPILAVLASSALGQTAAAFLLPPKASASAYAEDLRQLPNPGKLRAIIISPTSARLIFSLPDGKAAYASTSTSPQPSGTSLHEFNLDNGNTQRSCALADLDPVLQHLHVHTGYDAWDGSRQFYFASFDGQPDQPVILSRIDPGRLKAALDKRGSQ